MQKIMKSDSNFEGIRKGAYIYVDKTKYLRKIIGLLSKKEWKEIFTQRLAELGNEANANTKIDISVTDYERHYFMSGPRRFGKSITVNTLKAFYEGKKELFLGTEIAKFMKENEIDWEAIKHPVIHLKFNEIGSLKTESLQNNLSKALLKIAKHNNISLEKDSPENQILDLIEKMYDNTGKGAVVLIDEYDSPITSNLGKGKKRLEIAKANQEQLKDFYNMFKDRGDELEKLFITGISKFAKMSIFSALSNLINIMERDEFTGIIGYTEEELQNYFGEHIEAYAKKENISQEEAMHRIRLQYNGYRFFEKDVRLYNPYSIANSMSELKLLNYWFESGTPTFLVNLIKENKWNIFEYKTNKFTTSDLGAWEIDNIKLIPLLYQTGYLTIKEWDSENNILVGHPNQEVEKGFTLQLLPQLMKENYSGIIISSTIKETLLRGDYQKTIALIKDIFLNMAYLTIPSKNLEIAETVNGVKTIYTAREIYFQAIFNAVLFPLKSNDFKISSEVIKANGRIDMVIEMPNKIIIIEFKCDKSAEEAINQIKNNKYAECYKNEGKEIVLFGINFDSETKNIENWIAEENKNV